ncbi:putative cellulase (glycosyl hydrolase family 5) [Lyophyllum shimeji]|uniref:mannan endo-1,4-beta-mannosidase n=1 Tax=Lyophyllum shimeji TaxID=47721 RepID=A0A9P3PQW3_LYOSH|nr:putative cellulase (glycosyl hydrolase family 5) [Lyophyllum shimeji]
MISLKNLFLLAAAFALYPCLVVANDFAGANSYFLHTLSAVDRAAVLDAMQGANMKLLRVFITRVAAGAKGSSATAVNDLETVAVGSYDDTILRQIDVLASEAHARDIKLIIAMHDRYALGCWDTDAYVAKYNLPVTGCVNGVPDSSTFYTNANAISDFDNRLRHILNFQSPKFGVPWNKLSDAIFAFEIQNEAMGHMNQVAPDWWCGRANVIRSVLGNTGIQISTGGGTDLPTSTQSQLFNCPNIQIVALHDYNLDPSYVASHIDAAKPMALSSGKRLLYEEFGATGSSKQSQIQAVTNTLISTGVPWMYWEVMKPGKGSSDYEIWTDEPSWSTLRSQSLATRQHIGEFSWPEIDNDA